MNFNANSPLVVITEFPVRYAETDAMGVVHHATYLVYFEEGRSQFMREMGSDYAEIEASGFQLPVTEAAVRYVGSLRYGERVQIKCQLKENKSRRLTFNYEVANAAANKILVTGFTTHIWTDIEGKVTRAPLSWQQLYENFISSERKL